MRKQMTAACEESIYIHYCSSRATGPCGPRKDDASIMAVISAVLMECSGTRESPMGLGGYDGTKQDKDAPTRGSGIIRHPASVSPSKTRVPSVLMAFP